MISFINLNRDAPFLKFKQEFKRAVNAGQNIVEAMSVASYSASHNEVNARFVNLKYVDDKEFIFFSNYQSPKSKDFLNHEQVSTLFYWDSTNVQIRIKGIIKKTSKEFNSNYFKNRDKKKNALAISSKQSSKIISYEAVKKNYLECLKSQDLDVCPNFWGGFSITPYYFEFWEGHTSRINKRVAYELIDGSWKIFYLQP